MSKNNIEDINAKPVYVMNATANPLPVSLTTGSLGSITINPGDIEIGAVELKDATTDQRAIIDPNGRLDVYQLPIVTVPTQIIKTVAAIGTPEALAADATYFQSALIGGMKAARTPNVTGVYLGIGSGNDTQPFLINPSEWLSITVPPGQKFDLNDWYLDVLSAGDGVAIIYS